jgi:hypothetical protein
MKSVETSLLRLTRTTNLANFTHSYLPSYQGFLETFTTLRTLSYSKVHQGIKKSPTQNPIEESTGPIAIFLMSSRAMVFE